MPKKKPAGATPWVDPDDAPELTAAFFERAEIWKGDQLIRPGRGRPALPMPKPRVTLRLDADLLEQLRANGPGWQTRLNVAVREWLAREEAARG